jgi:ketosteroid isomerase-like protein
MLAFGGRLVLNLSPRSKLRRFAVRRAAQLAIEATNRGDYEAALVFWADDAQTINAPGVLTVGGAPDDESRSRSERIRYRQQWSADWEGFGFERVELIDLGNRLVLLVHARGRGLTSGVPFDQDSGFVLDLSGGRVVREQIFLDRAEALEAAGLSE